MLIALSVCCMACLSCKPKTVEKVTLMYSDGKPQIIAQYTVGEDGTETLCRETHYFPQEKKYMEGAYDTAGRRTGMWISWYESGQKNSQTAYLNGLEEGKTTVWYSNGKLRYRGQHAKGKTVGRWEFFDTAGVKVMEKTF
jgi:antitoxin component YwqK of YwqJK toxin-antitoxin module